MKAWVSMDTAFTLRPARYDDPDAVLLTRAVQAYYREIYGGEDSNPMDADEFVAPAGGFLLGYLDAEPVAMGGWRRFAESPPVPGTRPAELRRMFVRAEHRHRGLARRLLTALEDDARRHGADMMILEAGRPQTAALAFYAAAGYHPVPAFGYWQGESGVVQLGRRLDGRSDAAPEPPG